MNSTRREFLWSAAALCAIAPSGLHVRRAYDAIIAGGRVLDPALGIDGIQDIAVAGGRIAAVGPGLDRSGVRRIIDARGKLVTAGWIDVHVHVYPGVANLGIDPDLVGVARGVTAVVDAGSTGATSFAGFRDHVARTARTRVYALVNISRTGMMVPNELAILDYVNVDAAVRTIEENRDVAVGIKVRMLDGIQNDADLEVMRRAREAADRAGVPITVHIGGQKSPLPQVIRYLRPGDVITHAYRRVGNILDANGRVYPEVREAMASGIWLDIGHGMGNFDFDQAERILAQGVEPQLMSSDVHDGNVVGPVFDLPTTVSKLMALGLSLEKGVAACTGTPARIFDYGEDLGQLAVGAPADLAVFEVLDGDYTFVDSTGNTRPGTRRLAPYLTLRDGLPYGVARS